MADKDTAVKDIAGDCIRNPLRSLLFLFIPRVDRKGRNRR
jgi:hypothetical protein